MSRWALVRGGTCVTVVEQATQPTVGLGGLWVAAGSAGPGWTWDGNAWAAPSPAAVRSLSPRDFLRRFSAAEREALEDLAATGTANVRKKLAAFKTYVSTGGFVELDDDYIVAAVTAMETAGVVGAGRAAEILS